MKTRARYNTGFTLAELLVALMVSAIILSSVASLSYAISSASRGSDEMIAKQSRLRITMLRLRELIKNSKMICGSTASDIAIWKDDLDNDNQIDSDELIYIDAGDQNDTIKVLEFNNIAGMSIKISEIRSGSAKNFLIHSALKSESVFISECSNVSFAFDVNPPRSKFVVVKFEYKGKDNIRKYEIESTVITYSESLLDSSDELLTHEDD